MNEIVIYAKDKAFLTKLENSCNELGLPFILQPDFNSFKTYLQKSEDNIAIFNLNLAIQDSLIYFENNRIIRHSVCLLVNQVYDLPTELMSNIQGVFSYDEQQAIIKMRLQILANKKSNYIYRRFIEYKNLYAASKIINSTLNVDKALHLIIEIIANLLQASTISIMLIDQTRSELVVRAAKHKRNIIGQRIEIGKGISGTVALKGEPIFKPEIGSPIGENIKTDEEKYSSKSFMCIPLKAEGIVIGVMNVTDKLNNAHFNLDDKRIVMEMASQISTAIENAKMYSSVEVLALQDSLTKLYNRNFLNNSLTSEIKKAKSQNYTLSVLMLDIDFFKAINDNFGHQVGDEILKKVANILKFTLRKTDVAARYGGEEMIGVLVSADSTEAFNVSEKIRQNIEDMELYCISVQLKNKETKNILIQKHPNNSTDILLYPLTEKDHNLTQCEWEEKIRNVFAKKKTADISKSELNISKVNVTTSIGVSTFPQDFDLSSKSRLILESANENDLLIYMADKALYKAKKNGRNRTLTYKGVQEAQTLKFTKETEIKTITTVINKIKEKDWITYNHCLRVGKISELIAKKMHLPPDQLSLVKYGGILHDVGKIFMPDTILLKPGKLTDEEYAIMKTHPSKGAKFIEQYSILHKYINAIHLHHERTDGSGYPEKIEGDRIPIEAKIIAVADSFDAMISYRYYRDTNLKIDIEGAKNEIQNNIDKYYDHEVVEAFLGIIKQIGFLVKNWKPVLD
ncbi:diguanylate cyclase [Candidatus Margulisiibacteriota bacterium]